jgi:hypothetical protein
VHISVSDAGSDAWQMVSECIGLCLGPAVSWPMRCALCLHDNCTHASVANAALAWIYESDLLAQALPTCHNGILNNDCPLA